MWLEECAIRIGFVFNMEFVGCAIPRWQLLEVYASDTRLDAPTFIVGLDDTNRWIFNGLAIAVICGHSEGVLKVLRVFFVCSKEGVPRADHHICVVKCEKFDRLHGTIPKE